MSIEWWYSPMEWREIPPPLPVTTCQSALQCTPDEYGAFVTVYCRYEVRDHYGPHDYGTREECEEFRARYAKSVRTQYQLETRTIWDAVVAFETLRSELQREFS